MCGIAGFLEFSRDARPHEERTDILRRMGRQLARRGPDDEQIVCDDMLSLVFRRLSIMAVADGAQPIWNEDRTALVAVNGEIYNHRELRRNLQARHTFRTGSDCEVVLHLYEDLGVEAFARLDGIFSACIWDQRLRTLVLARDPLGVKPMFFSLGTTHLLFGSELKALRAHPLCSRELEWDDLHLGGPRDRFYCPDYLSRLPSYVKGVEVLPGGHYLTLRNGRCSGPIAYWRAEDSHLDVPHRVDELCERYAELLEGAVGRQLMSEVPVGAFLSGGLDSCAMVAVARRQGARIHCFNIVEESVERAGDARAAAELAELLQLEFSQIHFRDDHFRLTHTPGLSELEYFVWMLDTPFPDPEIFFKHEAHRYVKTVRPDIKVMLLGQGADEFAGGYSNSHAVSHASWDHYLSSQRRALFAQPYQASLDGCRLGDRLPVSYRAIMRRFCQSLQRYNLWHEDRTSASQGIESRVPFLDRGLVEFLWSIPEELHSTLFWDKEIERRAAARWLPERLCRRPKVPFLEGPDSSSLVRMFGTLFRNAWPDFLEKYVAVPDGLFGSKELAELAKRAPVDPAALDGLFRLMALAIFERLGRGGGQDDFAGIMTPPSFMRADSGERL